MKQTNDKQSSLLSKRHSFEGMTQLIRWLAILAVALTFWALPHNKLFIVVLFAAAIAYNLLRMTRLSDLPVAGSFITIIAVDLVFAFLAIGFTGGIHSPYIILLAPMAMSAAYWYGFRGLASVMAAEAVFAAGLIYGSELSAHEWPVALVPLLLMSIIAYYVLRLTQGDREERNDLRRLNTAVRRERRQLESLVNSLGDGVIAVDSDGMISLANKAAASLFGSTEMIGRSFDEAVELYDMQKHPVELFKKGSPEQEILRKDLIGKLKGEEISLEMRLTPFEVESEPQGTIIFARDITKQKSLEDERDEFISLASHELRTPLALTEGNLSMAMAPDSGQLNDKQKDLLKKTYRQILHLSAIVADLTTLDQADKGLLDVELERINIGEIVKQLIADYSEQAEAKGIKLAYEVDPGVKPVVTSKFRLVEILTNFLTNAIKYTSKGGNVEVKAAADTPGGGAVISISDTGVGISSTDKRKIFDKFYRSEEYHTRETEGTGLGLYIVKKLASRLNGEVWLESEVNKGSTFYLRVPQYSKFREDQPKVIAADVDSFIKGV